MTEKLELPPESLLRYRGTSLNGVGPNHILIGKFQTSRALCGIDVRWPMGRWHGSEARYAHRDDTCKRCWRILEAKQ